MKIIKRILLSLILLTIYNNATTWNETICGFSDVNLNSEYCLEIGIAKRLEILSGYDETNNLFKPSGTINRAEIIKVVAMSGKVYNPDITLKKCEATAPFDDVEVDSWYCPYVETAKNYGWIHGTGGGEDSLFNPAGNVTLVQALKILILSHAKKSSNVDTNKSIIFDKELNKFHEFDEDSETCTLTGGTNWYNTYVCWAKTKNLSFMDENNLNREIKREEVIRLNQQVFDSLNCNLTDNELKLIEENNPDFLTNSYPSCLEKSLYYSYLFFGSNLLNDRLLELESSMKTIEMAENIINTTLSGAQYLFTQKIGKDDNCKNHVDSLKKAIIQEQLNLGNQLSDNVISIIGNVLVYYCQYKKYRKVNPAAELQGITIEFAINNIFEILKLTSNIITQNLAKDEKTHKNSINIAFAVLGEYYTHGGNIEELFEEYNVTDKTLDSLISIIATKKDTYTLDTDTRLWDFSVDTFNLDITKRYIEKVFVIVNNHYKEVM